MELHAIMQDHYDMFQSIAETSLGKHSIYSPRQFIQKSKKKKFSSELDDKSTKREDFLSFQRMFSIFEKISKGKEGLLNQVLALNKICDREKNQPLQEAS